MNAFTTFPPRRMSLAAIEAMEDAARAERAEEREAHALAVRAYETTFEETATCVEACFEWGATAHAPACQRAAALAHPVAEAINGWLGSIAIRRAA